VIQVELVQDENRENLENQSQREDLEQLNRFAALDDINVDKEDIQNNDAAIEVSKNNENFIEEI